MATQHSRSAARLMMAPAVVLLLGWMLVPLTMTLYFSFRKYLPLRGGDLGWVGFDNYVRFVSSSAFWPSVMTTLTIVGGVLLTGGFGSIIGVFVGTITFAIVIKGIDFTAIDRNWANLIIGVMLLAAVAMNETFRKKAMTAVTKKKKG